MKKMQKNERGGKDARNEWQRRGNRSGAQSRQRQETGTEAREQRKGHGDIDGRQETGKGSKETGPGPRKQRREAGNRDRRH